MILSYSFPSFPTKIVKGDKKHTFRRDPKRRWKPGMLIQHWMGSPRFGRGKGAYEICQGVCTAVQPVEMRRIGGLVTVSFLDTGNSYYTNGSPFIVSENDGLTPEQFAEFFLPNIGDCWEGVCIHWTDIKY